MAEDLKDVFTPSLNGGLNLFDAPADIDGKELTDMSNLRMLNGRLVLDTGFAEYTAGSPVTGARRLFYDFRKKDGTRQRLLFTQTGLYYQTAGAPTTWVSAKDLAGTGDFSCTGSLTKPITAVTWLAEDKVIWTNGVDTVFEYYYNTGTSKWTCTALGGLAGGADPEVTTCASLAIWQDRLFLINCTMAGVANPHLIRWSDEAIEDEFTTGDAGFQYIYDDGGRIVHGEILESYLILYREKSITRLTWIGSDITLKYQTLIVSDGILGARSVAVTSDAHYVVMRRGIFKYSAGVTLEPIGQKIDQLIVGPGADVDLSKTDYMYGAFMFVQKTLWFSFGTTAGATIFLIYDLERGTWYRRDLAGLCTSLNVAWQAATNYYHLMTTQTAKVLDYDHATVTDAGAAMAWYFSTKNFAASRFIRSDHIELDALGTGTVTVQYSLNDGISWITFGTFALPAAAVLDLIPYKVFKEISARQIMFKVSGSAGTVKFGSFKLGYYDESEF